MKLRFVGISRFWATFVSLVIWFGVQGQDIEYLTKSNIPYYPDRIFNSDIYINEKCRLDIYYPTQIKNFPTVIWFHGGGLESGEKYIPEKLKNQGFSVVSVNYRLYPQVKKPKYLEDAAAAVAWVFKNIERYGGDAGQIFISGHSAGGYLASMIGIDKKWLKHHEIDANAIAGVIPFSGHTITHFTVRKERGIQGTQPIIDEFAPLFHVHKDAPPFLLITGDRELELLGRYEENAYFQRMMKITGHKDIGLFELKGYLHDMREPGYPLLINYVRKRSRLHSEGDSWKLVWSDEFEGNALDTLNWNIREAKPGWVNNELQEYVKHGTIAVTDGNLKITAKKEDSRYISGRIYSKGKREFQYGKMEFRAKLPSGNGTWPALWMLGSNIQEVGWPSCGEIDIMEHIGRLQNIVHGTVHTKRKAGAHPNTGGLKINTASSDFHTYTIEWDQEKILFFIDGFNYYTYAPKEKTAQNWPFDQPFYFIINFAVGGNWPGFDIEDEKLPQSLEVDYVRVFQKK
ncbi:MAG: family 16 glycosylhydrolase [Flavobacteriaceae bacterium]|nr:family 16 glycosylhydrolase [Flavobacteriaceae bacterium]